MSCPSLSTLFNPIAPTPLLPPCYAVASPSSKSSSPPLLRCSFIGSKSLSPPPLLRCSSLSSKSSYIPWAPHRQCVGLAYQRKRVGVPVVAASLANCNPHLHHTIRVAQGVLPCVGWKVTACQFDLPLLTPLFVAGCGRLQLETPYWATSAALLQVVDNWLHILF